MSLHPGAVLTDIFRELGLVAKAMPLALQLFSKPRGRAETTLWAATHTFELQSGSFYADCQNMDDVVSPLAKCKSTNTALSAEILEWLDC